ncbi:MAG: glycosyltransferase [Gammaproteobacteria bacterium]|nr:glycosyltransferase [Gammaproteobacteria bacterium]
MKVAIVHYWLVNMRGGEKVLEALCDIYPEADIFTHVVDQNSLSTKLRKHQIYTTFINKLPGAVKHYQKYLPLMPLALEQLDLREYDLVISSESGPAKGVITSPDSVHICYCHSPMRYLWDMYQDYLQNQSWFMRLLMRPLTHYLRLWDFASAARVDHFIANSEYVARRIAKCYRRSAQVVHPPVSLQDFSLAEDAVDGEYYLLLGQLVAYKRADLAVKAFNQMGKRLVVIGEGEQYEELKRIAGPNIEILGRQSFEKIQQYYASCKALIFPGVEDFGIVPLEAMASGRPVLAYAKGGALETVIDGVTGLFFHQQTVEALMDVVHRFEGLQADFVKAKISAHAQAYGVERFKQEIQAAIGEKINISK